MAFLITAMGRSGTQFLAATMNRSKQWRVAHEPSGFEPHTVEGYNVQRFQRPRYGEVNSRLRRVLMDIEVETRGVIIRDPDVLWRSIVNKRLANPAKIRKPLAKLADEFEEALELLDRYIQQGVITIRFEQMTTNISYLRNLLWRFGITDVQVNQKIVDKRINAVRPRVKSIEDIPAEFRHVAAQRGAWFRDKYYGEDEDRQVPTPV